MNAQGLAEIGSWVAANSGTLIYGTKQTADAAKKYWSAAKCRSLRWATTLRMFARDLEQDQNSDTFHDPWPAMQIVTQEILVSELLSRVWSAILVTYDTYMGQKEMGAIAHSIHVSHMEAKNRALRLMIRGRALNEEAYDRLNKMRHRLERWTDLYLAQLPSCPAAESFAFDPARVADFREENGGYDDGDRALRQGILMRSMAEDLSDVTNPFPANPELNAEIAAGVIALFVSDRFDVSGLPKVVHQVLLERAQYETNSLLEKLIRLENQSDEISISELPAAEWN